MRGLLDIEGFLHASAQDGYLSKQATADGPLGDGPCGRAPVLSPIASGGGDSSPGLRATPSGPAPSIGDWYLVLCTEAGALYTPPSLHTGIFANCLSDCCVENLLFL